VRVPAKLGKLIASLQERGPVRRAGGEWRTRCPAHADSGPSLYVRDQGDAGNILIRCNAGCDTEAILGRLNLAMTDLFYDDEAQVEIDDDLAPRAGAPAPRAGEIPVDAEGPRRKLETSEGGAPPAMRHDVYSRLLESLDLANRHRDGLRERGLDDDQIERRGYRSLEGFALRQAIGKLKSRFDEGSLLQIPGFRRTRGEVRFVDAEGLLIPVRDLDGKIIALKLRPDERGDGPKYLWVSSGDAGPSPGSPPHVPLGTPRQAATVRLTEGELKADVASALSGLPTIGVPGVASWQAGVPILRTMGARVVHLAFDADAWAKPGVAKDLVDCAERLRDEGFEVRLERWRPQHAKGVDDLLAGGRFPELVPEDRLHEVLDELRMVAAAQHYEDEEEQRWVPRAPGEGVAEFPLDCLPESLRKFATEAARVAQCPVDFLGLSMLAVAAAAIGSTRRLELREGYQEGCRLFAAIVAASGDGKTPARMMACRPVYERQKKFHEDYLKELDQYRVALDEYEAKRKEAMKGDGPPVSILDRPVKPSMGQAFLDSVTVEAVGKILARDPRGILLIRDELTAWVNAMNQYRSGKGDDREFYLSAWSGSPIKADRMNEEEQPRLVFDPCVSILGAIPPGKLAVLDAGNDGEDGFVHRILFAYPRRLASRSWDWDGLTEKATKPWDEAVEQLYGLAMVEDDEGNPAPKVLRLAEEARPIWKAWYDGHVAKAEAPDLDELHRAAAPKAVAHAARLALIVHLLRHACEKDVSGDEVDAESLGRGLKLIEYFESHRETVYARLRQPEEATRARRAIGWIRSHGGRCSPTQLARSNVAGVQRKKDALALMKELVDLGYGHLEEREAKNHRKVTCFVAKPLKSGSTRDK
jgi:hypothetical protein